MYKLTIEWLENAQLRAETFSATEAEQSKPIFRIGRDKQQCNIVVSDDTNTVSRLHAEIFLKEQKLCLRNATGARPQPNFVMVDGQKIIKQEVALKMGSKIQLGKLTLNVTALEISPPAANPLQSPQPSEQQEYGLQCINGHQVSYDHVKLFCPYCGTALQAVDTAIVPRTEKSA